MPVSSGSILHHAPRAVGWALAVLASGWLTVHTMRGPQRPPPAPPPTPQARPPTDAERATVEGLGAQLASELRRAHTIRGTPLPVSAYEGQAPTGVAWLPDGLPDNPLTPAVAWVWEGCPGQPSPSPPPDWLVCSRDGTLRAGGLLHSPAWSIVPAP